MRIVTVHLLIDEENESAIADEVGETLREWNANRHGNLVDWAYARDGRPENGPVVPFARATYQEGDFLPDIHY